MVSDPGLAEVVIAQLSGLMPAEICVKVTKMNCLLPTMAQGSPIAAEGNTFPICSGGEHVPETWNNSAWSSSEARRD